MFEQHMESCYPANQGNANQQGWKTSPQLAYLQAIGALGDHQERNTAYMSIDDKEFQRAKTALEKLLLVNNLERKESVLMGQQGSVAFGRGRLASLVDNADNWQQEQQKKADKIHDELAEKQAEQQKAQQAAERQASMTPHQLMVLELSEALESLSPTDRPPKIREVMAYFLDNVTKEETEAAAQLYQVASSINITKRLKSA